MKSLWPHRCANLLAGITFLSVFTGTAVTSSEERPFYWLGQTHVWLGAATALLTVAVAIGIQSSQKRGWLRWAAWIGVAAVAAQAIIGFQPLPQPPALRIVHTIVGQLFFPLVLSLAICTSPSSNKPAGAVNSGAMLRFLTGCTPVVVLAQVALGTLFRHGAMGVGPHLVGAFFAAFFVLGLALPVMYRPEHSAQQTAARCFLAIASLQVFLGLALFSMVSMDVDPSSVILVMIIHGGTGALTLAATVVMAVLIRHAAQGAGSQGPGAGPSANPAQSRDGVITV